MHFGIFPFTMVRPLAPGQFLDVVILKSPFSLFIAEIFSRKTKRKLPPPLVYMYIRFIEYHVC